MKHFAIKDEVYDRVIFHLSKKDPKVYIGAWVEKACRDQIKQETFFCVYQDGKEEV